MRFHSLVCIGLIFVLGRVNAAADDPRKRYETILDWLPADSESLVVMDCPWRIPNDNQKARVEEKTRTFDSVMRDYQLQSLLSAKQRQVLAGKTIRVWISAASNFHVERPPVKVERIVKADGYRLRYAGVHVIEFGADSEFKASELFSSILNTPPHGAFSGARKMDVLGNEVIEYSAMHMADNRPKGAGETSEASALIDVWFAYRFWMASPKPNVLIVATSKELLETTLNGVVTPSARAFPAEAPEWNDIDPDARVFGIRRFLRPRRETDYSDLRMFGADASALTFVYHGDAPTAKTSIRGANAKAQKRFESLLTEYVRGTSKKVVNNSDVLQVEIGWAETQSTLDNKRTPDGLTMLLCHWLGYTSII